jgi:hypothetical protein
VNQSTNFLDIWCATLIDQVWWRTISVNECQRLLANTQHAVDIKKDYYLQSGFDMINLTDLYKECELIALLKKNYE